MKEMTSSGELGRTTNQVAAELGLSNRRVLAIAKHRGLVRKLGSQWIFTPAEVQNMRTRATDRGPWLKYKVVSDAEPA